jgi:predicted DNA-binding transcriptional regulator YafY
VATVFGVTPNHITTDFRRYKRFCRGNIRYDEEARVYRPGRNFRPRISTGSAEEYLTLLRAYAETRSDAVLPVIGSSELPAEALPAPPFRMDRDVLRRITLAVREETGLEVLYQSLRETDPKVRTIWPHTLVYAGNRWHVRAFDSKRQLFRDFVLQRLTSVTPKRQKSPVPSKQDEGWTTRVTVEVIPNPMLSETQKKVIANEYGMERQDKRWVWAVELRRCMVRYFIFLNRLDSTNAKSSVVLADPSKFKDMRFGAD